MSDVKSLVRVSYSFKSETEEEGVFYPEQFILSHDQARLIPVVEFFNAAAVNTNAVFADFQTDLSEVKYKLQGRYFLNIEEIAGEASATYMQALKKHHEQRYKEGSIGFAIKRLATELKKSSVEDSGTEDFADNEVAAAAIKQFYTLWRGLSDSIK